MVRKEHRDRYPPPPKDIDSIMARFFLGVLKKDGTGYEPDSLGSVYNSLDRHLRDMKSPIGGCICPGALSSPILIEVKKSVITFMSLFVFVLVFLFKFSSKKNTSFLFIYYHTKLFVWYDIFFLIVGILI
jgi:hypothetical protein